MDTITIVGLLMGLGLILAGVWMAGSFMHSLGISKGGSYERDRSKS